jgi:hypothetical protein
MAGEWRRTSSDAISFSGTIEKDELQRFLAVYQATDKKLVVDSGGGNMDAALHIALILEGKVDVVVKGLCASSCANYFFIAGRRKVIERGIVGYHGDWKAMVSSQGFKEGVAQIAPEIRKPLLSYHTNMVELETAFLARAGVSQELFDMTQKENDDGLYDIYLPGPESFAKYGFRNVVGQQDLELLKQYPGVRVKTDGPSALPGSVNPPAPSAGTAP